MTLANAAAAPATANERRKRAAGAVLAAPAASLFATLLFLPSAAVLALSLTDYRLGGSAPAFIGVDNFARMAGDPGALRSASNTLAFVAVVGPLSVALGLWLATAIEAQTRLRGLLRTVFLLPVTATLVAMATAWEVVLHPAYGMANAALTALGFEKQRFLADPELALPALMAIGVWKLTGYNVLLYIAGIAAIPRERYDAAAVDGAEGGWRRFTLVTWPGLAPVTLFVTVITLIRAVSEFETVAVLTQGGPNGATEMALFTLHREAFRYFDVGYASALAVAFLVAVAAVSLLNVAGQDRRARRG